MKKFLTLLILAVVSNISLFSKKSNPTDSYAYNRGVEAYNEEKFQDALDWFNKELEEHPDNGYAYVYVSALRHVNQEYGLALSAIDNAIKRLPKKDKEWRSSAYGSRAEVYVALQDTVKALSDLADAIKIDPSNSKFYNARAQIYYEQTNYALADNDYRQMIKLNQGDVMGYMGIGRNATAQERWQDAVDQFSHVVKLAPDYSSGYSFRAEAYIGQKKWDEATDDIVKALDIDADGKAFYLFERIPSEATDLLKTKLKIQMAKQPAKGLWPYSIAALAQAKEDYETAIEFYTKAHTVDANSVFLEFIARCYLSLNDYTAALDYVDKALAMSPEDYDVIDLKADILNWLGSFEECITLRDKYVAKYPDNPFAYLSRADDLMSVRRFEKAIEDYDTAVVLASFLSDYPYLLMRRGDAYRFINRNDEAKKDYEHLLEVEKDSVLTSSSWTPFAYSGLGNAEKAVETMQFILANDTTDVAGTYYNAACVYARVGDKREALRYLSDAIKKGYPNISHMEVDYDLDLIRDLPEYKQLMDSVSPVQQIPIVEESKVKDEAGIFETVEVPFTKEGGVTKVKCTINGLPLHFVFDTGAADVTMSMVEANFMLKNDYIKPEDVIGSARYVDANGDITEGTVINLRKVNFGGMELDNVRASVVRNQRAPLLLGQSVLGRLGKIEIDNPGLKLIITHKSTK